LEKANIKPKNPAGFWADPSEGSKSGKNHSKSAKKHSKSSRVARPQFVHQQYHQVFFMGDLNWRTTLSRAEADRLMFEEQDHHKLLSYDQLKPLLVDRRKQGMLSAAGRD